MKAKIISAKQFSLVLGLFVFVPITTFAQVKIVCVGNSITAGAYPQKLQSLLGTGFTVYGKGVSSTTMLKNGDYPYWKTAEFQDIFRIKPNIITIKLGTNDSKASNWERHHASFQVDYNAMIDTFLTIIPKPQIWVVLNTPSFTNGFGINADTINNSIVPIEKLIAAQRNLPVIDCNTPLRGHSEYFYDGVHPNEAGFDSIAQIFYRNLLGKPIVKLSDTLLTVFYEKGDAKQVQVAKCTVINLISSTHLKAPVTFTNKLPWLSVTVDASNPDSQVLVNTINPSTFSDIDAIYYDTVTVHAEGVVPDQAYRVKVWVRNAPVITSIKIVPDSGKFPSNRSIQFTGTVIDQYGVPLVSQPALSWSSTTGTISADRLVSPAISSGTAYISATVNGNLALTDTAPILITPCKQGLVYDFYDQTFIESFTNIDARTPSKTGTTTNISIAPSTVTDSFALKFTGYIWVPVTGAYTLYTTSDDGSALYIDGKKVVDNDGNHGQEEKSGNILLSAGLHMITVLYFDQTGGRGITVRWQGPGIAKSMIPDSVLFYGTDPNVWEFLI